jgi:prenyltransferase beta subunit
MFQGRFARLLSSRSHFSYFNQSHNCLQQQNHFYYVHKEIRPAYLVLYSISEYVFVYTITNSVVVFWNYWSAVLGNTNFKKEP